MQDSFTGNESEITSRAELLTDSQLRALVRIAEHSLSSDPDGLETFVAGQIQHEMEADLCAVWRHYQGNPGLISLVSSARYVETTQFLEPGSQAEFVFYSESPVFIENVDTETRFRPANFSRQQKLKTGFSLPIIGAGHIHGVIDVYWRHQRRMGRSETAFMRLTGKVLAGALDQLMAREALARESANASVLIEIGQVVGSSLQISTIYERFSELVGCLIPFDRISLSLIEEQSGISRTAYSSGLDLGLVDPQAEHNVSGTITGEVLKRRRPVVVGSHNRAEFGARLPRFNRYLLAGLVSTLAVPVIWRDKIVAVLTLRSKREDSFSATEAALGMRIASLVAGAVVNSELHRSMNRLAFERLLLSDIGRYVNTAPDIRAAFTRLANGIGQLMPLDRMVLGVFDNSDEAFVLRFVTGVPIPDWQEGTVISVAESASQTAMATMQCHVFDPGSAEQLSPPMALTIARYKAAGLKSVMFMPLVFKGRIQGLIALSSKKLNAYGEHELGLADRIASLGTGFLAATRLEQEINRTHRQLDLAVTLAKTDVRTDSVAELAELIKEQVLSGLGCDLFTYCERLRGSDDFSVQSAAGLSSHIATVGDVVASLSTAGHVIPVAEFASKLSEMGFNSSEWIPVTNGSRIIGAVSAHYFQPPKSDGVSSRSLAHVAAILGVFQRSQAQTAEAANLDIRRFEHVAISTDEISNKTANSQFVRTVIADPHQLCRGTLRAMMVGSVMKVTGECASISDVHEASDGSCDLVLMGLHAQQGSDAIIAAGSMSHLFNILILAERLSIDGLREALRTGIRGYVNRSLSIQELESHALTLVRGGTVIDPSLLSVFMSRVHSSEIGLTGNEARLLAGMSERDVRILRSIASGMTNNEIAQELNLAIGSLRNRLVTIYRRIGVSDRVDATKFAMRAGLLK